MATSFRDALILLAALATPPLPARPEAPARTEAPKLTPYKLILVGDSTMAPHSGWGGAFCAHHVKWKVACVNLARGARSTRSFRAEGGWDLARAEMKVPGYRRVYVLIQMGHNDQARHKPERWTEEATEFPDNLRRFVRETRATGAVPVLLTPLTRRDFQDGVVLNTLASWSEQVRKVARQLDAPLVDLNARSAQAVQRMGPVAALALAQQPPDAGAIAAAATGNTLPPLYAPLAGAEDGEGSRPGPLGPRGHVGFKFDYTHVGDKGAALFAAMVAEDLAAVVPELSDLIVP